VADRTLFTIPCEAIFNTHRSVYRSALVPRGDSPNQTPVILIEPNAAAQRSTMRVELAELAAQNPLTQRIEEVIIRDQPLPVDIRHNSKIFRERLAAEIAVSA